MSWYSLGHGDISIFLTRPISAALLTIMIIAVVAFIVQQRKQDQARQTQAT